MNLTKRDILKRYGLGAAALAAGKSFGDESSHEPLPPGEYIADPLYGTCRYIRDIPKFPVDVPSAFLKDGKIVQPAREIACFRTERHRPCASHPCLYGDGTGGWHGCGPICKGGIVRPAY